MKGFFDVFRKYLNYIENYNLIINLIYFVKKWCISRKMCYNVFAARNKADIPTGMEGGRRMSQIIASTKEISNKRTSLIALSTSLRSQIENLENLGETLNAMWDGAAKDSYVRRLKADIAKMKTLLKAITEFIEVLQKIIEIYNATEKKNQSTAAG